MATERRLHIGGKEPKAGWEIVDIYDAPHVDHKRFDLVPTLKEWRRVLTDGGTLYVSVPNLGTLCKLFIDDDTTPQESFDIMRMMFGGHMTEHDFHLVGLDPTLLADFLTQAGFRNIRKVDSFDLFDDTSANRFKGTLISCNMIAEK